MGNDNLTSNLTFEKKVELVFYDLYNSSEDFLLETIKDFPSFQLINKEHAKSVFTIGSIFQLVRFLQSGKFPIEYCRNFLKEIKKVGNLKIPNFQMRVDEFLKGVDPIKQELKIKYKALNDDHLYSLQFAAGYLMFCNLFSRFPSMESEDELNQISQLTLKSFKKVMNYWGEKKELYFS